MFLKIQEIIYYIKIFYDIFVLKNKEQFQQKLEVKFEVVVVNHGVKKVLDVLEQVQIVHLYGKVGVLFLDLNLKKFFLKLNKKERRLALQTLLYNKKNNIVLLKFRK
jgi:hypothetical protein